MVPRILSYKHAYSISLPGKGASARVRGLYVTFWVSIIRTLRVKQSSIGTAEMARWLRVRAALLADPGSVNTVVVHSHG